LINTRYDKSGPYTSEEYLEKGGWKHLQNASSPFETLFIKFEDDSCHYPFFPPLPFPFPFPLELEDGEPAEVGVAFGATVGFGVGVNDCAVAEGLVANVGVDVAACCCVDVVTVGCSVDDGPCAPFCD
jgi:hypothetical protein